MSDQYQSIDQRKSCAGFLRQHSLADPPQAALDLLIFFWARCQVQHVELMPALFRASAASSPFLHHTLVLTVCLPLFLVSRSDSWSSPTATISK